MTVELYLRLVSNVPPRNLTQRGVQNGHDPAVHVDTQALEIPAILDEFPPSAFAPHPRLSFHLLELPPYHRPDGRFAVGDIDVGGWSWVECLGWRCSKFVSRTRLGLLWCNVRLGAGAIPGLLRLHDSVYSEGSSSKRRTWGTRCILSHRGNLWKWA